MLDLRRHRVNQANPEAIDIGRPADFQGSPHGNAANSVTLAIVLIDVPSDRRNRRISANPPRTG